MLINMFMLHAHATYNVYGSRRGTADNPDRDKSRTAHFVDATECFHLSV